jgi:hypothetical protein
VEPGGGGANEDSDCSILSQTSTWSENLCFILANQSSRSFAVRYIISLLHLALGHTFAELRGIRKMTT